METEQTVTAAYIPFATFITGLDHLATISIPNHIETKTFPYMNAHNRAQMVSALKFFNLIDKGGKPQPFLYTLVNNKEESERKANIKKLIEENYPDIVAIDFAGMTQTELDKALSGQRYNVSGDTKKKAKTFLLKAAQFAGFSPHYLLTKITRNRKRGGERKQATVAGKAETNGGASTSAETGIQPPRKSRGSEKTVQLRSGAGSVTLSIDVDLLELEPGEEQDFVLKLRDTIRAYEKGLQAETDSSVLPLDEVNRFEKGAGE